MRSHTGCMSELLSAAEAVATAAGGIPVSGLEIIEGVRPEERSPKWHPMEVYTCPHGIEFYLQPTQAQLDAWAEAGTP